MSREEWNWVILGLIILYIVVRYGFALYIERQLIRFQAEVVENKDFTDVK